MSGKLVQLSVLSLALLAVVTAQTAAKTKVTSCYQCNSAEENQGKCETTDELDEKWKKPCAPPVSSNSKFTDAVGCRKMTQKVEDHTRVVRECAYTGGDVDGQKRTGNKGILIYYYQCSADNCNGSPTIVASFGALLLACVVSLLRQ
uniref:Protein sleepless n=1 Tax=Plectus sambesii TaxID=2011161 RepID=A0A914W7U5_9BILA